MRLELHEIKGLNTWVWVAKSFYEMTSTILRPSECYESTNKDFRDKPFLLEDYMDWYAEKYGNFTYYTDWYGFNLPVKYIKKLKEFKQLTKKEKALIKATKKLPDDAYVIAVCEEDEGAFSTFRHEMSHAIFRKDKLYREDVTEFMKKQLNNSITKKLEKSLKKEYGYCDKVILDESVAYIIEYSTPYQSDIDTYLSDNQKMILGFRSELLRNIFYKYHDYYMMNNPETWNILHNKLQ